MANILSFVEVVNIAVGHTKIDISKEKVINVHIKYQLPPLKECAQGLFYTNIDYPSMITNPTSVSGNAYYYLYTAIFKNWL